MFMKPLPYYFKALFLRSLFGIGISTGFFYYNSVSGQKMNLASNGWRIPKINDSTIVFSKDSLYRNPLTRYIFVLPQLDKNPNDLVPFNNDEANTFMSIWDKKMVELSRNKEDITFLKALNELSIHILLLDLGRCYRKCHHSFTEKGKTSFRKNSTHFQQILLDLNTLLSFEINPHSFPSTYRQDLEGTDSQGRNGLESNASFWEIRDLIKDVYIPRWVIYKEYIQDCLDHHKKPDINWINEKMRSQELTWINQFKLKPKSPIISNQKWTQSLQSLYAKYQEINFTIE